MEHYHPQTRDDLQPKLEAFAIIVQHCLVLKALQEKLTVDETFILTKASELVAHVEEIKEGTQPKT